LALEDAAGLSLVKTGEGIFQASYAVLSWWASPPAGAVTSLLALIAL